MGYAVEGGGCDCEAGSVIEIRIWTDIWVISAPLIPTIIVAKCTRQFRNLIRSFELPLVN